MIDHCGDGRGEPGTHGFTITPDDNIELTDLARALYVGEAGNLAVTLFDGTVLTFVGVPAGTFLPIRVRKVRSTNTTASSILGLY